MVKLSYDDEEEFWSLNRLMSYNADISIAMSIRNLGKTYSAVKMLKERVKQGANVCFSRWNDSELKLAVAEVFDGEKVGKNPAENTWVKEIINPSVYKVTNVQSGGSFYFLSVKMAYKHKGLDIKNLKFWVWDEFLPEFYENITHRNELNIKFNSLYTTLRRNNQDFRVILLSNSISWFNPLFAQWGIMPFPIGEIRTFTQKSKIKLHDDYIMPEIRIVMENVKPTKKQVERVIRDEVMKGKSSAIIEYLNNTTKDNFTLYEKCPDMSIPLHQADWVYLGVCYTFRIHNDILYWVEGKTRDSF